VTTENKEHSERISRLTTLSEQELRRL